MAMTQFRIPCRSGGVFQALGPGVTPVWAYLCDADGNSIAGTELAPAISPQGVIPGVFVFSVDLATVGGALFGIIDLGLTVPSPYDRYVWVDTGGDTVSALAGMESKLDLLYAYFFNRREFPTNGTGDIIVYDSGTNPTVLKTLKTKNTGQITTITP